VTVVILAAAAASLALASSPATQVATTLKAEAAVFNARHWRALWILHTPRYRSTCSYAKYVAAEKRVRARAGRVRTTNVRVTLVSPRRAVARYFLITQSHQTIREFGDVYAKVGSRWLDELDRPGTAGCGY
jgi:hypothetical protein